MSEESRGNPSRGSAETENTNKNEDDEELRSELLQDVLEWLQDFKENLVDKNVQPHQKWYRARVSTVSVFTSRKTEIVTSTWRKNEGFLQKTCWYSRAQSGNFGDLITADHKIRSEGSESHNNHRYAVVVQDLATQWLQSYPCKTKNFSGNPEDPAGVLGADKETRSHLH